MRKPAVLTAIGGAILGAVLTILVLSVVNGVKTKFDGVVNGSSTVVTDTVYMPGETVTEVVERFSKPREVGIVERVTTVEVKADTVYIATADTAQPLPDYAMLEVDKEDETLEVTALRLDGTEVQKHVLTLPDDDADFNVQSGAQPVSVRAERGWDLLDLEAQFTLLAGAQGVSGVVSGPVTVNVLDGVGVSPAVGTVGGDTFVGVTIHVDF